MATTESWVSQRSGKRVVALALAAFTAVLEDLDKTGMAKGSVMCAGNIKDAVKRLSGNGANYPSRGHALSLQKSPLSP